MPRLGEIPVSSEAGGLTGSAPAVLREIADLLDRLQRTGETGTIDLGGLPLSPADRRWLLEQLGKGEVEMTLDAGGSSRMVETGYPGVWWIEHRNEQETKVAEFIEVAPVPELIPAHPDAVASGLEKLQIRISELS
jgi:hydrogenase-1 operon protein HyaF